MLIEITCVCVFFTNFLLPEMLKTCDYYFTPFIFGKNKNLVWILQMNPDDLVRLFVERGFLWYIWLRRSLHFIHFTTPAIDLLFKKVK